MGGLYTAHQLLKNSDIKDVVVLEARRSVGGRVVTSMEESDSKPKFNDFAWRIGETNTMMLEIAKEFGVELVEQFTPPQEAKHGGSWDTSPRAENRPPLSTFSAASLDSTAAADLQDRESGYAGRTAQITFPGETHGAKNWFPTVSS